MITIHEVIKKKNISKLSNAVNIFNLMKAEVNKDPSVHTFVLDFVGVHTCPPHIFKEVFRQMQTRLNGEYRVELKNANQIIVASFRRAING